MDFKELIGQLSKVNEELREHGIRAINTSLTLRNWFFGFYILEFEQHGKDRAQYGEGLLKKIAAEIRMLGVPNADERELRRYRQFYEVYPKIVSCISLNDQVRSLLPASSLESQMTGDLIRGSLNPELQVPDFHYLNLLSNISYTHFAELIRLEDPLKRLFYELECLRGGWNIKELKRQIGSLLYERTALSQNKEKLLEQVHEESPVNASPGLIRDPYVFEFIGLKKHEVIQEKEMEQALGQTEIIRRLAFCFVRTKTRNM